MFYFEQWWFWIFLGFLAIFFVVVKYKSRKLPPKEKALLELSSSTYIFGLITMILTFGLLMSGFHTSIPEKIDSLEEAQKILQKHNESLFNLKNSIYFFFLYLWIVLFPAIYNFAKAITPNDEVKTVDLKVEERKPILGLNDK